MDFSEIIGQEHLKNHLQTTAENQRIPHAQLFVGQTGTGLLPMAIAYARSLLCLGLPTGSDARKVSEQKVDKLMHPDLHFVYPVTKRNSNHRNPISKDFSVEWRNFIQDNPYGSLLDWMQSIGLENKQGNIGVSEAQDIVKTLSLKSYEGGYKVMIMWMADRMNNECSNKILKLIEEPPHKTVLLLLTEQEDSLLETIKSRCQTLHFPLLAEVDIAQALIEKENVENATATKISRLAQGNYHRALKLLQSDGNDADFETWFITLFRIAYMVSKKKDETLKLVSWSDTLASIGREPQKAFLGYCLETIRQALLTNYNTKELVYFESNDKSFSIDKFAPFVHDGNIFKYTAAIEEAIYHVERNGSAKLIFSDLAMQFARAVHAKSSYQTT